MNIGRLNQRITIQNSTIESDPVGNRVQSWQDCYSCYAMVSGENGVERTDAGRTVDGTTCVFTMRYSSEMDGISSRSHRVLFQNEVYNILSVDHMSYKNQTIKLYCEKVTD